MKPARLWLLLPWALFALLAAGWCAYWFSTAAAAEAALDAAFVAERARGADVSCARRERRGFPVLLRINARDCVYAPADRAWRASAPELDLHVNLTNASSWGVTLRAPFSVTNARGETTTLSASSLIATASARHTRFSLEADALVIDSASGEGAFSIDHLVLNARRDPRAPADVQVAVELSGVTLARPARAFEGFGTAIATLRAGLVLTGAREVLGAPSSGALAAWLEEGARLRIDGAALTWGPLNGEFRGELGVDSAHRLAGQIDLRGDFSAAAPALMQGAPTPRVARSLAPFASAKTIRMSAHDGALDLDGVTLRQLAPLY